MVSCTLYYALAGFNLSRIKLHKVDKKYFLMLHPEKESILAVIKKHPLPQVLFSIYDTLNPASKY